MNDTNSPDAGRADLLIELHRTRRQYTDDAARMLTMVETGTCPCEDDCECPEVDRSYALEAARTYAMLAQAAVQEAAALTGWWAR